MISDDLAYATGYIHIDYKFTKNGVEPILIFLDDCPEDIKERVLKEWDRVKKETLERQKRGCIRSTDAF